MLPHTLEKLGGRLLVVAIVTIAGSVSYAITGTEVGAQDAIKIGLSAPLTGPFAENGKQMIAAARWSVYMGSASNYCPAITCLNS